MSESVDEVAAVLGAEISPQTEPRDQRGHAIERAEAPEPMFELREIEGDPETGDTGDGGDDLQLRSRERDLADGREPRRRQDVSKTANVDEDGIPFEIEPDDSTPVAEAAQAEDEGDEKYEVTVDGAVRHVTLAEALRGYIRQETFHQRATQLNQIQQNLEVDAGRQQQNWGLLLAARQAYEEDLQGLLPREPNWDQAFAVNPQEAHRQQKIFQVIYGKLAQSRQQRAEMEAIRAQENDRRIHQYAVNGFSKFVMDNQIPDEPTLQKELRSMRRTAAMVGFSEYEVATVYDPRMLTVLRKASKYDRMMANRPNAIQPGRGKTLTPGAATPLGNVRRSGLDDAQRRLAQSGKLSDAVDVFRRIL